MTVYINTRIILDIKYLTSTGCSYKLSRRNLMWGPLKCSKSNFNPVHVFLHFNSFCLVVLKLILASKLSELEQFENRTANYRIASRKGWKWEKIKLLLLQSFRKGVVWHSDVVLAVEFNFKGGFLSWIASPCQKSPFFKAWQYHQLDFFSFSPFSACYPVICVDEFVLVNYYIMKY